MAKVTFPDLRKTIEVPVGQNLLQACQKNGINMLTICGGNARCTACCVKIDKGVENAVAPFKGEEHKLGPIKIKDQFRLGCQLKVTGDMEVRLTPKGKI
jgi:adenylate cyclase